MSVAHIAGAKAVGKIAENKYTPIVLGVVVLGGGLISYFLVVKPVLQAIGILESKDDKLEQELMEMKAFNPNFSNPTKVSIAPDRAKDLADILYNSISWYNDREDKIYNAIQQAGSNHNMSVVSRYFGIKYGEALSSYIVGNLNVTEMKKVRDIINNF